MSKPTTVAELIAALQELPPETHVIRLTGWVHYEHVDLGRHVDVKAYTIIKHSESNWFTADTMTGKTPCIIL